MNERLLQYLWQHGYYNYANLHSTGGIPIQVLKPGQPNPNQGPDFLEAKVRVGRETWVGNIELHMRSSDWKRHGHGEDKNYNNIILHVVWEHDDPFARPLPVLELKDRVSNILLERYENLVRESHPIPCAGISRDVRDITWTGWKERLAVERLIRKSGMIFGLLKQSNDHWEETCWWLLARVFGTPVNAMAFETIAQSLPLSVLARHKGQIHQLESLLIGQAGLLDGSFSEEYPALLRREYQFLKIKHRLTGIHYPVHFLRMRPANFPTIRLAQLAMLIHNSVHLFSRVRDARTMDEARSLFQVTANDYWHYHYRFEEMSAFKPKTVGSTMIDSLLINTVAPLLFAYGSYHQNPYFRTKAMQWLESTRPEANKVLKSFQGVTDAPLHAADSQALLELRTEYCDKKRCLECAVGSEILKGRETPSPQ